MNKKKKGSIFLKILGFLFIIYLALFIANMSGYYESKIRENVTITDDKIKEFEDKVQNGEKIDLNSFLINEQEDYSSKLSNIGDTLSNGFETVVSYGANIIFDIFKSLF